MIGFCILLNFSGRIFNLPLCAIIIPRPKFMKKKVSFASVISARGFKYLWINQILLQLAINTLNFSLLIWVYKLTGSNFAVSALLFAVYLPSLLFGLFAGVLVDLSDRKKMIYTLDLLFALSFLLFIFIKGSYPLILLNTFLINTLSQFFIPAESSSIPMLLNKSKLFLANSLFTLTLYSSFMLGFAMAGPVLNFWGINSVFYLGSALLFLAFFVSFQLPSLKSTHKNGTGKLLPFVIDEIIQTFQFIRGKVNVLVAIGLLAGVQGIIGVLGVLIPSYMEDVLRIHATDASYMLIIPLGLGMILGAFLAGRFFYGLPRRLVVMPSIVFSGILLFAVGVAPYVANWLNATDLPQKIYHLRYFFNAPSLSSAFAVMAFLMGLVAVAIIIPSQTVLQEVTHHQIRGKIFAVLVVAMNSFALLPVLLAGGLADLFGVTPIFMALGIIVFLIGVCVLKPGLIFGENFLPFRVREFLGLGHWEGK